VPHIVQRLSRQVDFNGSTFVGVSERGYVVLDDKDRHISLLRGPQCLTAARIELPGEVEYQCYKAVDSSGRVLLQAKEDADTMCLNNEGREIYRIQCSGFLITCMSDILCYGERIAGTDNDFRIRLQRGADGAAVFLEPPGRWSRCLSVCRNNNGTYWVAEYRTRSLDIFTSAGQPPYKLKLL
jgi:hypothetical protein